MTKLLSFGMCGFTYALYAQVILEYRFYIKKLTVYWLNAFDLAGLHWSFGTSAHMWQKCGRVLQWIRMIGETGNLLPDVLGPHEYSYMQSTQEACSNANLTNLLPFKPCAFRASSAISNLTPH